MTKSSQLKIAKPALDEKAQAFVEAASEEKKEAEPKEESGGKKVRLTLSLDQEVVIALKVASVKERRPAAAIISELVREHIKP